jgi:hypothetical protein
VCQSVDPETFFPAPSEPADAAIALCRTCDVQGACLAWALEVGDCHGVWGATTPRERRAMLVAWRTESRVDALLEEPIGVAVKLAGPPGVPEPVPGRPEPPPSHPLPGHQVPDRVFELVPGQRTRLPLLSERRVERCAKTGLVERVAS